VSGVDHAGVSEINPARRGDLVDLAGPAHENGRDQSLGAGLDGPGQCRFLAGCATAVTTGSRRLHRSSSCSYLPVPDFESCGLARVPSTERHPTMPVRPRNCVGGPSLDHDDGALTGRSGHGNAQKLPFSRPPNSTSGPGWPGRFPTGCALVSWTTGRPLQRRPRLEVMANGTGRQERLRPAGVIPHYGRSAVGRSTRNAGPTMVIYAVSAVLALATAGTLAVIVVPRAGCERTVNSPPSNRTRSRMLASPNPP